MRHDHGSTDDLKSRAADRVRLDLDALLTSENGPQVPIAISDFSRSGFCCRCSERLEIGSRVALHVPNLDAFPATIVWQLGVDAGARFDSPLPVSTVLSVVLLAVQQELSQQAPIALIDDAA